MTTVPGGSGPRNGQTWDEFLLRSGIYSLPNLAIADSWYDDGRHCYVADIATVQIQDSSLIARTAADYLRLGEAVVFNDACGNQTTALITEIRETTLLLREAVNYMHIPVSHLRASNPEQSIMLNHLLGKDDCVSVGGILGCGKTSVALAAGYELVRRGLFESILYIREPVATGRRLGYSPGNPQEKLSNSMGELFGAQAFLARLESEAAGKGPGSAASDKARKKGIPLRLTQPSGVAIAMTSLVDLEGLTLPKQYVILDSAHHLTPEEIFLVLGRMGEGSKIVILGNLDQLSKRDGVTKYSSGFKHLVDCMGNYKGYVHVNLVECVRSTLAAYVARNFFKGCY